MSNIKSIAKKSLKKLMQYLKDEEMHFQQKMYAIQFKLDYNRIIQKTLLQIVSEEEKKNKKRKKK